LPSNCFQAIKHYKTTCNRTNCKHVNRHHLATSCTHVQTIYVQRLKPFSNNIYNNDITSLPSDHHLILHSQDWKCRALCLFQNPVVAWWQWQGPCSHIYHAAEETVAVLTNKGYKSHHPHATVSRAIQQHHKRNNRIDCA
jgi:hypothetical protein